MKTLEEAILKVKENPSKYIGEPSLRRLNLFILGYTLSQADEGNNLSNYLDGFQKFVQQKYNIKHSIRFSEIIRCFSSSDSHAFERFYELLEEFYKEGSHQEVES